MESLWNLYGKQYDLTSFLEKHPGGKDVLLRTIGEKDSTVLFETYHAFSKKADIVQWLQKYEIKNNWYRVAY